MKTTKETMNIAVLAAGLAFSLTHPIAADGIGVSVGSVADVSVGRSDRSTVSANVLSSGNSNSSSTVSANVLSRGNSDNSSTVSANVLSSGNSNDSSTVSANVLSRGDTGEDTSEPGAETPTNASTPPPSARTPRTQRQRRSFFGRRGNNDIRSTDFLNIILISEDNQVLGIVQSASLLEDGQVVIDVQLNDALSTGREMTRLQFLPSSRPNEQIRFGMTAREFAASL